MTIAQRLLSVGLTCTLAAVGVAAIAPAAEAASTTLNYTGGAQSYVVPTGVTALAVHACGAQGGGSTGGLGACVDSTVTVTAGETLQVYVGGAGAVPASGLIAAGGFNGGGMSGRNGASGNPGSGGGASDVRRGGVALADRVIVAGGGGGSTIANAGTETRSGGTGGAVGGDGIGGPSGSTGGKGATASAGGAAGTGSGNAGTVGVLGIGGDGGITVSSQGGGGGGGGLFGGGGGRTGNTTTGAGGGGSSLGTTYQSGVQSGNGLVTISTPGPLSFSSGAFPAATVGVAAALTVTVSNSTAAAVTVSAITPAGTGVASVGGSCAVSNQIAASSSCTVDLTWTPTSVGALSAGSLTVGYTGGGTFADALTLSGSAVTNAPTLSFAADTLTITPAPGAPAASKYVIHYNTPARVAAGGTPPTSAWGIWAKNWPANTTSIDLGDSGAKTVSGCQALGAGSTCFRPAVVGEQGVGFAQRKVYRVFAFIGAAWTAPSAELTVER